MAPCVCNPHFTECAPGPREVKDVARVPQQPGQKLSWFQPTTPSHLLRSRPWQCRVRETKTCHPGAKPGSPDADILKQRHGRPWCLPSPGTGLRETLRSTAPVARSPCCPLPGPGPLRSPCCPPPGPVPLRSPCCPLPGPVPPHSPCCPPPGPDLLHSPYCPPPGPGPLCNPCCLPLSPAQEQGGCFSSGLFQSLQFYNF